MDPITTVLVLMFAVTVLALLAERLKVPYPTVMIVGGLAICFLPRLQHVVVDPKVIFSVFLPPLLYGAAWVTSWKDFWAHIRPIGLLAIAMVLATMVGVACVAMALIPGMTWPAAFALGAVISPPDAIAVTALTKRVRIPREVVLILEGESLVNDATALVALRFAIVAATTGTFSFWNAAGHFGMVAAGGIGLGLLVGWVVAEVHKRLDDSLIETTITFLTPYAAYLLAETIHLSGVLAVVTAGLYVSWRSPELFGPRLRLQATAVWEFVLFVLNGLVFVLLGLQLPTVLKELPRYSMGDLIGFVAVITGAVVLIRLVLVFAGAYVPRPLSWRGQGQCVSGKRVFLIGWTGMRGAVSLAAAMALPIATEGPGGFEHRNLIVFVTFGVILMTLVVQSLTLRAVIAALRLGDNADEMEEERAARLAQARAGLAYIREITSATDAFGEVGPRLQTQYQQRITELEQGFGVLPVTQLGVQVSPFEVHKAVLNEERQVLLELRGARKIGYEVFQRLMEEVDADELRLEKRRMRAGRTENSVTST